MRFMNQRGQDDIGALRRYEDEFGPWGHHIPVVAQMIKVARARYGHGKFHVAHKDPLALGGSPVDPANLQVLPLAKHIRKNHTDRKMTKVYAELEVCRATIEAAGRHP